MKAGKELWRQIASVIASLQLDKRLVFSMDEFFVLLDNQGQRWTWYRAVADAPIPLSQSKTGFTSSVTVNAAGEVVMFDAIWEGATSTVHADVFHPKLTQHHRTGSHFQNATTFAVWAKNLAAHANQVKLQCGLDGVTPLLVIDQATQHGEYASLFPGWAIIHVPKCMTHIYQPCDQYVIANIRKYLVAAWRQDVIQASFANAPQEQAVKMCFPTSIPVLRKCKMELMCKAIDSLTVADIERSWDKTGLLRALFQQVPREPVLFDIIQQLEGGGVQEDVWQDAPQPQQPLQPQVQPQQPPQAEQQPQQPPQQQPQQPAQQQTAAGAPNSTGNLVQLISDQPQPQTALNASNGALVRVPRKRGRPTTEEARPKPNPNVPSILQQVKAAAARHPVREPIDSPPPTPIQNSNIVPIPPHPAETQVVEGPEETELEIVEAFDEA